MTKVKKEWFTRVGVTVGVLIMLGTGLTQLGILPWATATEVKALWTLKNQDNKWYREMAVKVAKIEVEIKHLRNGQEEIKQLIRGQ